MIYIILSILIRQCDDCISLFRTSFGVPRGVLLLVRLAMCNPRARAASGVARDSIPPNAERKRPRLVVANKSKLFRAKPSDSTATHRHTLGG